MKAEIVSIGTELVTGQNLDTNSQWLSRRLWEMGVEVHWHTTLADNLTENVQAFEVAIDRARLVVITGGLGPTQDDLTRQALAQLAGVELELDTASLQRIERMFARRGRVLPPANRVQAEFPKGSEPILNRVGTAPGIWMEYRDAILVAMPGVPTEMRIMFEQQVRPRLAALVGETGVWVERRVNCFGAGESDIEARIRDLTQRGHVPEVGITVSDAIITLRIRAHASNRDEADRLIQPVLRTIQFRLGDLVFGYDEQTLNNVTGQLLVGKKKTLALAENATGGLLSQRLLQVSGVEDRFVAGVVASSPAALAQLMQLSSIPTDSVDEADAQEIAQSCRDRYQTDLAISTLTEKETRSGLSSPLSRTFVALAWSDGCTSASWNWGGRHGEVQSRTCHLALNLLRLYLLGRDLASVANATQDDKEE